MNRFLTFITLPLLLLSLTGCGSSPADKVKQLEDQKAALRESSGYNACIAKVKANEEGDKKCIKDKLAVKGYTDGIDCIQNPNNPICKKTERYNAEGDAYNDCLDKYFGPSNLSEIDCATMLMKAEAGQ